MALVGHNERRVGGFLRWISAAAKTTAAAAERRVVHRVLGLGRRWRCSLVGIFEELGSAYGNTAAVVAGYKAMTRALIVVFGMLLAAANSSFAQAPPEPVQPPVSAAGPAAPRAWESLSPAQQQLLQSYHGGWNALPPERQDALAKGSGRWLAMTPQQRENAQQRFTQWRAMPPEQRQELRQRWQQFKSLPQEQQQRVREQFRRFRQMPLERRQELRRQWQHMSPAQRHNIIQQRRNSAGHNPARHNPR
jgi:hypothetical protein